jgi:hypothetical protein
MKSMSCTQLISRSGSDTFKGLAWHSSDSLQHPQMSFIIFIFNIITKFIKISPFTIPASYLIFNTIEIIVVVIRNNILILH